MSAAGLLASKRDFSCLRPVYLRHDLRAIADLMEVCFASTLDPAGRAAIQEMRAISRSGPLLWVIARLGKVVPLMPGFVWIEGGRVVGNVTITPAHYGDGWVIANVAVYPEYRGQGIAHHLIHAALDQIARQGAFATLQVDADNAPARHVYEGLGFQTQRLFTRWRRAGYHRPPASPPELPPLHRLARREAGQSYALARRVRPDARGGMGWLRPTRPGDFRPPRLGTLQALISGQQSDFWIVPGQGDQIDAALRVESRIGSLSTAFDLLVSPERAGELEAPLISFALGLPGMHHHPFVTDHPADDEAGNAALREHHFIPERTLVHMVRPVP
ncbi:MAG TPA: N-acetyltransferase [Aggregatilineaceae bacterium]|nr:N-acetyltransferase [Aggregatilineaceae bacterium]